MEIAFSFQPSFVAVIATVLCSLLAFIAFRSIEVSRIRKAKSAESAVDASDTGGAGCNCSFSCNGGLTVEGSGSAASASTAGVSSQYLNGGAVEMVEKTPVASERQTGASMMEQLVPEITTHALSYLDYPSLCRLSMTNSLMRKAANDDNAWKALYHKDFTLEQDSVTPANGWKAYYAATRTIVNINAEFFDIIKKRSLLSMSNFWLNADYVKCVHASGQLFSGYNSVIRSWQLAFEWEQQVDFQIRDLRARVLADMAWVTMKTYVDMETGPFHVTNIYELHSGRWYMVHHHSSVMEPEVEQQIVHG